MQAGFSIDASVRITLVDRDVPSYFRSLEHLLRYCAWPPFALERLSVTRDASGRASKVRYVAFITEPGPIRKILTHLGELGRGPADARKTPPKRARGVSRKQLPTPGPLLLEAHESLISSKTIAAVPLTGLSLIESVP